MKFTLLCAIALSAGALAAPIANSLSTRAGCNGYWAAKYEDDLTAEELVERDVACEAEARSTALETRAGCNGYWAAKYEDDLTAEELAERDVACEG